MTVGVVLAGWQVFSASATGHPNLPARTAAQLLAAAQTSKVDSLSGTITESAALGLPELPGADSSASLSWQSLITGAHTARVWIAGPDKQRIALIGTLAESDVIHNGRNVWTYSSEQNEASHFVLPAHASRTGHVVEPAVPDARDYTPMGVAKMILKALDPTTRVTVDPTQVVAGHDAYTLVLSPRDARSTVRKVTIALDSRRFIPLQVQVYGSGSSPAFQIGFTRNLSFAAPADSLFDFHVPAGVTVTSNPLIGRDGTEGDTATVGGDSTSPHNTVVETKAPKILGSGWTSIAYFAGGLPAGLGGGVLDRATSPTGSSGDRLLSTSLLNVLFTKDGRVFIGAVTPSMLEHTAAATPR
ncbi:MAG: hypothetical protein QOH89_38 [Pseudonocardiales bacterium]|nr:hypothetical protein [Pseudonocardiales bacterium]